MRKSSGNTDTAPVFENIVPISSIDILRAGVNKENNTAIVEFGFVKEDRHFAMDVRKELTAEMVYDLIQALSDCVQSLKK